MKINTLKAVRLHGLVLMLCSLVGITGYYLQYHYFQISSCIPASVGINLLLISRLKLKEQSIKYILLFFTTLIFGIILTRMSIKFIPQDFQPIRKRIYFPVMALSSVFTIVVMVKNYLLHKKTLIK